MRIKAHACWRKSRYWWLRAPLQVVSVLLVWLLQGQGHGWAATSAASRTFEMSPASGDVVRQGGCAGHWWYSVAFPVPLGTVQDPEVDCTVFQSRANHSLEPTCWACEKNAQILWEMLRAKK